MAKVTRNVAAEIVDVEPVAVPDDSAAPAVAGAIVPAAGTVKQGEIVDDTEVRAMQGIAQLIGQIVGPVADNFPDDKLVRWKLDNQATTGQSISLADLVNETIEVQFWRVEAVQITNYENGEVDTAPRAVLFLRDGRVVHASSIGVFQVVSSFARLFGRDELPPGFKLKVAGIKTRAGWRMLTLQAL